MTRVATLRLVLVRDQDEELEFRDLGRVTHEVEPLDLWGQLPDRDTDDDEFLVLELWSEDERFRWLLDEREVDRSIAVALTEGRLDELIRDSSPRCVA